MRDICGIQKGRRQTDQLTLRVSRRACRCVFETIATIMTIQRPNIPPTLYETSHARMGKTASDLESRGTQFLEANLPTPHHHQAQLPQLAFPRKQSPSNVYSLIPSRSPIHPTIHPPYSLSTPSPTAAQATLLDSTFGLSHIQGASRNCPPCHCSPPWSHAAGPTVP